MVGEVISVVQLVWLSRTALFDKHMPQAVMCFSRNQ